MTPNLAPIEAPAENPLRSRADCILAAHRVRAELARLRSLIDGAIRRCEQSAP